MTILVPGKALAEAAKKALGLPYVWGGNSLISGVDCSGLVQQVFRQFGINVPRVTYEQVGIGASVTRKNLAVGDLVFFDTDREKKGPDHVGIYLGNGKFIHAPSQNKPVQISSLADSYYNDRLMAIRRVPGVSGQASGIGAIDPATFGGQTEEVRKSKDELAEIYGFSEAFFNSIPELKRLFGNAVANTWDAALFTAHLKNTKWWKETSETNRKAQLAAKSDPATYKASIEAARVQASQMAVKMGASLSNASLDKLAKNIVHFGWEEAHIQNFLGQFITFNEKKVTGGLAGQTYQRLRTLAYDNGVRMSDQSLHNMAAYVVRGVSSMEDAQANIRGIAMGTYPGYADQIQAGVAIKDIAQPYVQAMAQTLELPDTDIDVFNSKIAAALNRAGADGKPSPMSLTDFISSLKDTPDWRKTANAGNSVMTAGRQVLRDMGLM